MTEIPGLVERIGRAIAGLRRGDYEKDFALFDAEACAILVAHEAALRDAGMVIVPREATHAMSDAYIRARDVSTERWEAMVAAAQRGCVDETLADSHWGRFMQTGGSAPPDKSK